MEGVTCLRNCLLYFPRKQIHTDSHSHAGAAPSPPEYLHTAPNLPVIRSTHGPVLVLGRSVGFRFPACDHFFLFSLSLGRFSKSQKRASAPLAGTSLSPGPIPTTPAPAPVPTPDDGATDTDYDDTAFGALVSTKSPLTTRPPSPQCQSRPHPSPCYKTMTT